MQAVFRQKIAFKMQKIGHKGEKYAKSTKTRDFYRSMRKFKFLQKNESDMPVKLIEFTRGVYLAIKLVSIPPPSVCLEKVGCPQSCLNSDLAL